LDESKKLLFSILAVILVLGLIGTAFYLDGKKLTEAKAQLQAKASEEAQLKQRIDVEIPHLKKQLAAETGKVADYEEALPSAQEIESMDETLNNYKLQAGVSLLERRPVREQVRRGVQAAPPLYYKYSYRLSMLADFFALGRFMTLLEGHERFIRIDEFNIKVDDEETGQLAITMKMSTFSYAKVEQPTAATTTPPLAGALR